MQKRQWETKNRQKGWMLTHITEGQITEHNILGQRRRTNIINKIYHRIMTCRTKY